MVEVKKEKAKIKKTGDRILTTDSRPQTKALRKNTIHPVILSGQLKKQTQSRRSPRTQRLMKNTFKSGKKCQNLSKTTKNHVNKSYFVSRISYFDTEFV